MTAAPPNRQKRPRGLREWRHALGFSQQDVARMLDVSQVTISSIERGTCRCPNKITAMRQVLLDVARGRLNEARWRRREERITQAITQAWDSLPAAAKQKLLCALSDLARFKLDSLDMDVADGIGLVMPGDEYLTLLDEYFEEAA